MLYRIAVTVLVFVAAIVALFPIASLAGDDTPSIHIVSPNGGEQWEYNSIHIIQWEYAGSFPERARFYVALVRDDDKEVMMVIGEGVIIFDSYGPQTLFDWQIPNVIKPSSDYKVVVGAILPPTESGGTNTFLAADFSDTPFSIVADTTTPPVPAEPIVWLEDVVLRMQQNQASAGLHIEIEGIISVEMSISTQVLAPVTEAVLNPTLSDWALVRRLDEKGTLHIAAAGATPAPTDSAVLWLLFDTSQMLPGDWFSFLPAISWNEGPWASIVGRIAFFPVAGDVTVDGEVTAFDGVRVLQYSVGLATAASALGLIPAVADVSGNGTISGYDAGLIFRFVAGLINEFPRESYGVAEEIKGVVSKTEASTTIASSKLVASEPTRVWLGQMTSDASGYTIPVVIDRMDGVLAGRLEIGPVSDGVLLEPTKLLEGYQIVTNQQNGKLLVSFAGASSPEGGGEMLWLKFSAKPTRLTVNIQLNENPAVILSTAVQATSWGRIKATFAR